MKKLIAIAFIFIHLFNIGGALAIRQYFVYKSDKLFTAQADKNLYNVNDLTEIKIPSSMPGITEWPGYIRAFGHVEFEKASYNFVKMKIARDGIYLMCIPNYSTTHLFNDNVINAKNIKDIPVPKKEHVPFGKMKALDTYKFAFSQFAFTAAVKSVKIFVIQPVQQVFSHALDIPEQPPKLSC